MAVIGIVIGGLIVWLITRSNSVNSFQRLCEEHEVEYNKLKRQLIGPLALRLQDKFGIPAENIYGQMWPNLEVNADVLQKVLADEYDIVAALALTAGENNYPQNYIVSLTRACLCRPHYEILKEHGTLNLPVSVRSKLDEESLFGFEKLEDVAVHVHECSWCRKQAAKVLASRK